MMTSRAEHRLYLRQDNADLRLTELSHRIGLASDERLRRMERKQKETQALLQRLRDEGLYELLKQPGNDLDTLLPEAADYGQPAREQAQIDASGGYLGMNL